MSNWISVKERLPIDEYKEFNKMYPDDDFEVIVMIEGATIPTVLCSDGTIFWNYGFDDHDYYNVTHWQPFPEPPKGDA